MRALVVVVVLWSLPAAADTRLGVRTVGGFEGLMLEHLRPEPIGELGVSLARVTPGKSWGFVVAVDRVARGYDDVANEWHVDGGFVFSASHGAVHGIVAFGYRSLTIPGGQFRPASTIGGLDVIRIEEQVRMVRRGAVTLDFCIGWTLGGYHGTRFEDRMGDMKQPTRELWAGTTAYMFGVQTTVTLD